MLNKNDELKVFIEAQTPVLRVHQMRHGVCSCGKACSTPGKHPAERNGVHSAAPVTDFTLFENFNVGVACGYGFVVLDIDPRNGGDERLDDLEAKHGELPRTWTVATGGGGKHFYFACEHGERSGHRIKGIDLVGLGGYVVAPTSIHPSGKAYEWECHPDETPLAPIPQWIFDECRGVRSVENGENVESSSIPSYSEEDIIEMLQYLDPEVGNAEWVKIGMCLQDGGYSIDIFDNWSKSASNYAGRKDVEIRWKSFGKRENKDKVTIRTLRYEARKAGWRESDLQEVEFDDPEFEAITVQKKEVEIEFPPGAIGLAAKEILEHAVNKSHRFALVSALSIGAPIAQAKYLTPEHGVLGLYLSIVTQAGKGKSDYIGPVNATLKALEKALEFPKESFLWKIPKSAHYVKNTLNRLPCTIFVHDEGLAWFRATMTSTSEMNEEIRQDLLMSWSGNDLLGFGVKDPANATEPVENPRLSILFAGTYDVLENLFMEGAALAGGGLFSRIDFVLSQVVTDEEKERTGAFKPSKELLSALRKPLSSLTHHKTLDMPKNDGKKVGSALDKLTVSERTVLKWASREVRAKWKSIEKEYRRLGESSEHGQTVWNRCAEKILRIASIVAIFDNGQTVEMEHLEWATAFQMASVRDMQRLCDDYLGKSLETQCREKFIEAAKRAGGRVTLGKVQAYWKKFPHVPQDTVRRAIERLEVEGIIEPCQKTKRGALLLTLKNLT